MPWMPSARKREIGWLNSLSRHGSKPTAVVLHITASNADSQYGYFSRIRFAGSHFHVARNGHIEQYAGTGARSAADRSSRRTISVETQGAWGPWTDAQVRALAEIVVWCHKVHGIPLRLMTSSRTSQHGIGWHRLGVKGNFSRGLLGGYLQRGGGEVWSGSYGKACPTDPCIRQLDDVLRIAKELNARDGGASRDDDRKPRRGKKRKPNRLATLRLGSRRGRTKHLQQALASTGDYKGKIDAIFGKKTDAAVKHFQRRTGLVVDGIVGAKTWYRLCQGLSKGSKNPRVRILKTVCSMSSVGPAGRTIGKVTESNMKKVQRWLGVVPDGKWGPITVAALIRRG